jgi:hypothetical protein
MGSRVYHSYAIADGPAANGSLPRPLDCVTRPSSCGEKGARVQAVLSPPSGHCPQIPRGQQQKPEQVTIPALRPSGACGLSPSHPIGGGRWAIERRRDVMVSLRCRRQQIAGARPSVSMGVLSPPPRLPRPTAKHSRRLPVTGN